jgi:hypothetical protein
MLGRHGAQLFRAQTRPTFCCTAQNLRIALPRKWTGTVGLEAFDFVDPCIEVTGLGKGGEILFHESSAAHYCEVAEFSLALLSSAQRTPE